MSISVSKMLGEFCKKFVNEAEFRNPNRFTQQSFTSEELVSYCEFLMDRRIKTVNGECKDWRELKVLVIPSYIQYVLSMVGTVIKRDFGLKLTPVLDRSMNTNIKGVTKDVMTLAEARVISEKLAYFERDLSLVQDAMPRGVEGNDDVMSTALIGGYVRAFKKVEHISATYVCAFLDMKLKESLAINALYRYQYDDYNYIESAFASQRGLY